MPLTADSFRGRLDLPGNPRSSSLGRSTITVLPFQGTLFLSRGVVAFAARLATDLEGVMGILGSPLGALACPFDLDPAS
jgi:hypothetical protein